MKLRRLRLRTRALLRPWTWLKVAASMNALVTNAVQLSEVSDPETGAPLAGLGLERRWHSTAELVALEATQVRKHLGVL